MKQRTTLKRARGQYNLLPKSTVQINLPNGDKLLLINTQGQETTFLSLDISSESNLQTTVHDNKQYENYSTESVSVDSKKNGRLGTYFNVTSCLHPKAEKEIPTHSEILAHIENNPVGTDGYTNSGTPTDKTYEDAKRELEG